MTTDYQRYFYRTETYRNVRYITFTLNSQRDKIKILNHEKNIFGPLFNFGNIYGFKMKLVR